MPAEPARRHRGTRETSPPPPAAPAGSSRPPAAGEGQQPGGGQQALDLAKLRPASDKAGQIGRQVRPFTPAGSIPHLTGQGTPPATGGEGSYGWPRPGSSMPGSMLANGTSAASLTARTASRLSAMNNDSRRSWRARKIDRR